MKSLLMVLAAALWLMGCKEASDDSGTPVIMAERGEVVMQIHAEGELEAVKSTPITAPASSRRPQTLAWILPQFTKVREGDVVARFDGSNFQIEVDETAFEIQKIMYSLLAKDREIDNSKFSFDEESKVVDYEYELAKQFNIDDPLLYTKIEMIEASDNETFLKAKSEHIEQVEANYETKSETEKAVLNSSKQMQEAKMAMNQASLSALEVIAPHDGLFVLEPSWDGSLPEPGKSIFPGGKLASLPDLSEMQAKVLVPEVEAIGIEPGQKVKVSLHAFADTSYLGEVREVSQTAQPKERDNPVKYFTITVALDKTNTSQMIPGQRLSAGIQVVNETDAVAIPIQTVFRDQDQAWVYLLDGDQFSKKTIETGFCSAAMCTVKAGLKGGESIALTEPLGSENSGVIL